MVPAGVTFETQHVMIVLENQVVMSLRFWTDGLVVLFGLVYSLHLSYPEKLSSFFELIQVVLLDLDDGRKQLKPKLQVLRNELELLTCFIAECQKFGFHATCQKLLLGLLCVDLQILCKLQEFFFNLTVIKYWIKTEIYWKKKF